MLWGAGSGVTLTWIQIPPPSLTLCVTLGKNVTCPIQKKG